MNVGQTVIEVFEQACQRYPHNPAFTCLGHTLNYSEINQLSRHFSAYLQHCTGLQPGDRIAVQLPNLLQYPVVIFGALRAGLIVVNTNPLYTAREMLHQFTDSGAKALITLQTMSETAITIAHQCAIETVIVTDPLDLHTAPDNETNPKAVDTNGISVTTLRNVLTQGSTLTVEPVDIEPEQIATLQYTGGTTGVAKGAMLSHRNLVANTRQFTQRAIEHFREGMEIYVTPLPLYHIYAFSIHLIGMLSRGGHNLLIPNPRDIDALVAAIKPFRFTGFVGINTLFKALCLHQGFRQLDFSALISTSAGGMALTPDCSEKWLALTGVTISEGYGMTETSPVISSNPPGQVQVGTVGLPMPDTEIKVIDDRGNTLPVDTAGELCVRGPQVMQGYWQRPEATAEVLSAEGWLKTGDIALIQADGYLRIVDRLKDMIVVSGFNVYPNEIEAIASMHPSVLECAAIATPSEKTGEAIKLLVVASDEDFDSQHLRDFLRTQLTGYKVPALIELIKELPKSNVGKILRRELR
ncbi:AMP-binding protein [Oceanicoccus sp. KOV_DT_Chl]|uniref:AMP-binding protein n=1 Tax=Oceanicoccus sp. KOV_DT_Chl TaxID=1904639 RepID=UPI000C7DFBFD|nr:AMP-binding protein [Oceanicoccus sp. KOV_DT_Chl]